jgi:hypothetical protein
MPAVTARSPPPSTANSSGAPHASALSAAHALRLTLYQPINLFLGAAGGHTGDSSTGGVDSEKGPNADGHRNAAQINLLAKNNQVG